MIYLSLHYPPIRTTTANNLGSQLQARAGDIHTKLSSQSTQRCLGALTYGSLPLTLYLANQL